MKKFSKAIAMVLILAMAVVLLASCNNSGNGGTLKVGTNPEFPPFEYVNDKGEPDGFDIALIKEIGKIIGMEVVIESMEFKSLVSSIESGMIDCSIAGMTVTEERKQSVNFSDGYFFANQKVIVKKDNTEITSLDSLNGKRIGVQEGTTGDFLATDGEEDSDFTGTSEVSRFKKGLDAIIELQNGRVDAVIIDSNPAAVFVADNDDIMIVESIAFQPETYAIAISKNNEDLLKKINDALKTLKDNGTYDKLVAEYIS